MAQVNIRMDDDLKLRADALFDELGMSITTAFLIFVKQSLRERGIPFAISANAASHRPVTDEVLVEKVAALERISEDLGKLNETEPLPPEFDEIMAKRLHFDSGVTF
jgi:DNA-damage-inducible protein J